MDYNFRDIEKKWQQIWKERKTYRVENDPSKPKYYALDMFPYPSGAGLHVGHPLGYIASDIVSRYKRLQGFNVLHPMGFDSFGLPAEQYAIQTGQHPEKTTKENIARYIDQMNKIGFSFDWDREVWTSNPDYYKWTQWIFLQIFGSWYNNKSKKAESIDTLIAIFEKEGFSTPLEATSGGDSILTGDIEHELKPFTAEQWKKFSEKEKSDVLMNFRLAYLGEAWVNWCPQLGTVLANDEVKDGVSERGGYPVERKRMPQWSMRITAYADRLLNDLDGLDWTESMKEAQRNWIGRSEGTSLRFKTQGARHEIEVFTTRPDTIFGVTFVTLAPEHELIAQITTAEQKKVVDEYVTMAKNRSERERMADVKKVTGAYTGAYVIHPFTNEKVPVWTGDYVLAGYGTGAVMGVPAHDSRDHAFAKHFNLPIVQVIEGPAGHDFSKESYDSKDSKCVNSDILNGLEVKDAIRKIVSEIEKRGLGKGKVNYRLRDAAFGRQRYWGEPIPIYYDNGIPKGVDERDLPLVLPQVDKFLPTESGEPPLARAKDWVYSPQPRPFSKGEGGTLSRENSKGEGGTLAREASSYELSDDEENNIVSEAVKPYLTGKLEMWQKLKAMARDNRKNPTDAEEKLWQALRNKSTGYKIRRQHPIDFFIVDFICIPNKLIIEVDGGYHNDADQKLYDEQRTFVLNQMGFEVIRFTNEEVLTNLSSVIERIKAALATTRKVLSTGEDLGEAKKAYPLETTTMPGWAGSSWYYLRYMDPKNTKELVSKDAVNYWKNVDLYIGGTEHATGHLLYVRFWTKFLFDRGYIPVQEPAQKLINQGMIQGVSALAYRIAVVSQSWSDQDGQENLNLKDVPSLFVSKRIAEDMEKTNYKTIHPEVTRVLQSFTEIAKKKNPEATGSFEARFAVTRHFDVMFLENENQLDLRKLKEFGDPEERGAVYITDDGKFECVREVEKMSKSKKNVLSPDDRFISNETGEKLVIKGIIEDYGADTLRMYEMFLGPLEQSKPWNTNGITGVFGFLKKFWRLFDLENQQSTIGDQPSEAELKILNRTLKKISDDIDRYSFNTCVSQFMICVNELNDLKCSKRAVLEPLVIALSPFAPHIAEELWEMLGHKTSVTTAAFPKIDEKYLVDDSFNYPVQINGKVRFNFSASLQLTPADVEKEVLSSEEAKKWLEGKTPKKVIVVPKRIVNIVI